MATSEPLHQLIADLRLVIGQRTAEDFATAIHTFTRTIISTALNSRPTRADVEADIAHARELHEQTSHNSAHAPLLMPDAIRRAITTEVLEQIQAHTDELHDNDYDIGPNDILKEAMELLTDLRTLTSAAAHQPQPDPQEHLDFLAAFTRCCQDQIDSAIKAHLTVHHTPATPDAALSAAQRAEVGATLDSAIRTHCLTRHYDEGKE